MSELQKLIDMGFEESRAEYAMQVTNHEGLEAAMEWLLAYSDEELPRQSGGGSDDTPSPSTAPAVRSLKCEDCGKTFKNEEEMHFHVMETNHSNFFETYEKKPSLTAEEREAQLTLIEEQIKRKRLEREEQEKIEAQEREKNRIKTGKDMAEAIRKMQELEMKEIVEQRKRAKAEEKAARERIRAQIEADKAERKAKEQQQTAKSTPAALPSEITQSANVKSTRKDYKETRIQIRLFDGATLTETFSIKDQLSVVRAFIETKIGNEVPFQLMTTFPRKIFADEDYEKSLEAMGLIPTAVLIMRKTTSEFNDHQ